MQLNSRLWIAAVLSSLMFVPSAHAFRPMEFLEQYDLKDLSYVGMIVEKCGSRKISYARFQDLEGFTHRAGFGEYVGLNSGVLFEINENAVKLREYVQDAAGAWGERDVVMHRKEKRATRARAGFEEELMLAKGDPGARLLRHKLIVCRELFRQDDNRRLKCFDDATRAP